MCVTAFPFVIQTGADPQPWDTERTGNYMAIDEWTKLKHGQKIRHMSGRIEEVYIWNETRYIAGEKSLFPLSEFDHRKWEKVD